MRKLLVLVVALALSGALAQQKAFGEASVGFGAEFPSGSSNSFFSFNVGAGLEATPSLSVRVNLGIRFIQNQTRFAFGADALYALLLDNNIKAYIGGGLEGLNLNAGTTFGIRGIAGAEFDLGNNIGVFAEIRPGYNLGSGAGGFAYVSLAAGPRFHFRF